jgi:hypothetical protein
MTRRNWFPSWWPISRPLVAIGLFAAIGLSTHSARGDSGSAAPNATATTRSSEASDPAWLFAVERSAQPAAPQAPSAKASGSLILMEMRAQRGTAKTERFVPSDADPRTKPLGW